MNKASDIQEFKHLFNLWLEAETSLSQEKRLCELARSLQGDRLDSRLQKDVMMALTLDLIGREASAEADSSLDPDAFADFVEDTLQSLPHRRSRSRFWLWGSLTSAAAAALLLLLTVDKKERTLQSDPVAPVPEAAVCHVTTDRHVAETPVAVSRIQAPSVSASPTKPAKPKPVKSVSCRQSQTLEVREVTDPQEAALILAKSCDLLASCLSRAELRTQEALSSVNDNINSIYSEI